jgi:hypothetical protein
MTLIFGKIVKLGSIKILNVEQIRAIKEFKSCTKIVEFLTKKRKIKN